MRLVIRIDDLVRENELDEAEVDRRTLLLKQRVEAYRLAEIRRKQKMTQAELADKMGISQKRVSEVETGRVGSLRLSTLERYAEGIGGKLHVVIEFPNEEDVLLEA